MTQIISIQNNKGGLGKTTLVTNLAGVLSKEYADRNGITFFETPIPTLISNHNLL